MAITNLGCTVHTWRWNPLVGRKINLMGHRWHFKRKKTTENFIVRLHFLLFYEMFASVIYIYLRNESKNIFTVGL